MKPKRYGKREWTVLALAAIASTLLLRVVPAQGAVMAPIVGEIERISLDNPADVWSGGRIVVRGDNVVIPRNLLIDLPANRLTLQQLFAQAPPCVPGQRRDRPGQGRPVQHPREGRVGDHLREPYRRRGRDRGGRADLEGGGERDGDGHVRELHRRVLPSQRDPRRQRDGGDGAGERPVGPSHDPAGAGVRSRQRGELQRGLAVRDRLHQLHLRVRDGVPAVHPERGQRGERVDGCGGPVLPVDEPPGAPVAGFDAVRARRPWGQPLGDGELRAGGGGAVPLRAHGEGVRRRDDAEPADAAGLHDLQRRGVGRAGISLQPGRGAVPRCDVPARLPGGHLLGALRHRQRPARDPAGDDGEQPGERRRRLPRRTDRRLRYRAERGLYERDRSGGGPGAVPRPDHRRRPRDLRLLLQPVDACAELPADEPGRAGGGGADPAQGDLEPRGGHPGHPGKRGPQRPVPDAGGDRVPRHGGDRPGEDPDAVQFLGRAVEPGPSALPGRVHRSVRGDAAAALSVPVRGDRPADAVAAGAGARSQPDPVVLPVRAVQRPGVAAGRPRVDRRHPRRAPGVGLRSRCGPAAGHRRPRRDVPGRAGDDRRPGQRRLRVQPRQRGVRDDRDRAAPRDGGPRPRHRRGALHPGPRLRGPGCLHLHLHGPCGGGVQRRHGGCHRQPDVRRAGGRQ